MTEGVNKLIISAVISTQKDGHLFNEKCIIRLSQHFTLKINKKLIKVFEQRSDKRGMHIKKAIIYEHERMLHSASQMFGG